MLDDRSARLDFLSGYKQPRELENSLLISLRSKYVYHPIGKVANSSIKAFLLEAELRRMGVQQNKAKLNKNTVHPSTRDVFLRPKQISADLLKEILSSEEYFRFFFVRHPVTRLVSCFLDRAQSIGSSAHKQIMAGLGKEIGSELSFPEFVDFVSGQSVIDMNMHWRPQYYEAMANHIAYDAVYHFESLSEDMKEVIGRLYPDQKRKVNFSRNYSPKSTSASGSIEELVDPDTERKIRAIYEVDFEAFGY